MNVNLGYTYILARRYPEAIVQLRKTEELDPTVPYTHGSLGEALSLSGDVLGAIAEYEKAAGVAQARGRGGEFHALAFLAHLYGSKGEREKALGLLEEVKKIEERVGAVWCYGYAIIQIGLGDKEQAVDWLERSCQASETGVITYIKVDPLLDPLRGNPRFEALANKIIPPDVK
jgi:tetratricopeptide (TPR) repeat protein